MAKQSFIKIYHSVFFNPDIILNLKGEPFKFLIYILLKAYRQQNKLIFSMKPREIYDEFNTSHSKLWRLQKDLLKLKIKITYSHKQYGFNLTDFFNNYYPKYIKNETVENKNCS